MHRMACRELPRDWKPRVEHFTETSAMQTADVPLGRPA